MRILVVDDDEIEVALIANALAGSGDEVVTATDGGEALARARAGDVDLVVSDWVMPGMDGVELCRRLRESAPRYVYFVLVTSRDGVEDVVAGFDAGADDFIPKPFEPVELEARVRAIRRLRELQERVERQNRELLRTQVLKDEWTRMLVHDLRSPLTVAQGYCQLAQPRAKGTIDAEMDIVGRELARMGEMLEQMLLMAKSEEGRLRPQRAPSDVAQLVRSALRAMEPAARARGVRLEGPAGDDPRVLDGDASLLRRLIDNLVSNAVKFSPAGGVVSVSLADGEGELVLRVTDEGPGVPEEAVPRLFEKYEVAELRRMGVPQHGLGLAFCRLVTAAHGGSIGYSRRDPRGSCFEARLPSGSPMHPPVEKRAEEPALAGACPR